MRQGTKRARGGGRGCGERPDVRGQCSTATLWSWGGRGELHSAGCYWEGVGWSRRKRSTSTYTDRRG